MSRDLMSCAHCPKLATQHEEWKQGQHLEKQPSHGCPHKAVLAKMWSIKGCQQMHYDQHPSISTVQRTGQSSPRGMTSMQDCDI